MIPPKATQQSNDSDVLRIVKQHLIEHGYDGLYNSRGDCGCETSDLSPGACLEEQCAAGYRVPCDPETCPVEGKCGWHIAGRRAE